MLCLIESRTPARAQKAGTGSRCRDYYARLNETMAEWSPAVALRRPPGRAARPCHTGVSCYSGSRHAPMWLSILNSSASFPS